MGEKREGERPTIESDEKYRLEPIAECTQKGFKLINLIAN